MRLCPALASSEGFEAIKRPEHGTRHPALRSSLLVPSVGALGGCSANSAPAVILLGAYFPDWLVFAILTMLFAIVMRVVAGIIGRAEAIPYPLFTCLAVGILIAGAIQLLGLGR
jgi:hypothetical protein